MRRYGALRRGPVAYSQPGNAGVVMQCPCPPGVVSPDGVAHASKHGRSHARLAKARSATALSKVPRTLRVGDRSAIRLQQSRRAARVYWRRRSPWWVTSIGRRVFARTVYPPTLDDINRAILLSLDAAMRAHVEAHMRRSAAACALLAHVPATVG